MLDAAIKEAYEHGYLGENVHDTGQTINIYTHPGAGAYICGEETGLIESLEGKRGQPRNKTTLPCCARRIHETYRRPKCGNLVQPTFYCWQWCRMVHPDGTNLRGCTI